MISLDDYEALEETSYLVRSPKNARRLLASIADLEAGAPLQAARARDPRRAEGIPHPKGGRRPRSTDDRPRGE
jgi:hypothetical protein